MADVLCFGNLQCDVLCRPLIALPEPGALRMLDAIDVTLSGNGGNVAAALARLGVEVSLAGYSGADVIGEQFRATLAAQGVRVDRLLRHPSAGSGTSVIALAPNGERTIVFVNGANALFDLDDVPDEWLEGTGVVFAGSVFVLPQFTGETVGRLFTRAQGRGAKTVLNVCWDGERRGLPFLIPALEETDYLVLNHDEGRQLTGHEAPDAILDRLNVHVRGTTIMTLGPDGCCLREEGTLRQVPALPVEATDCTGAGDCFVAGFIAGLVKGLPPAACARLGCRVAACAVTGPGAYTRVPPLSEIDGSAEGGSQADATSGHNKENGAANGR